MDKEFIIFDDIETEKHKFYLYKSSIFLKYVDTDNILKSKKISSSEEIYKYFTVYIDDYKINPFGIIFPKRGHM